MFHHSHNFLDFSPIRPSEFCEPGFPGIDFRIIIFVVTSSVTAGPEVSVLVTSVGRLTREVLVLLPDAAVLTLIGLEDGVGAGVRVRERVRVVVHVLVRLRQQVHFGRGRWVVLLHGGFPLFLDVA